MTNEKLTRAIMRRIYAVWTIRTAANSFLVRGIFLGILSIELRQYISVKHVLANSPSFVNDFWASAAFFANAFSHTHISAQILLTTIAALILWTARDTFLMRREYTRA